MVYVNRHLMREKLRRYAKLVHGAVLDVGAGNKPYSALFAVDRYIGVNARKHYLPTIPLDVEANTDVWLDGDAGGLPFERRAFNGVVCFQVLAVIANPGTFFQELARVLEPGGHLLLGTDFLYPKWSADDWFRYTDVSLRSLALAHGFEVVAIESCGGWMTTIHCLLMRHVRDCLGQVHAAPTRPRKAWRLLLCLGWLVTLPLWAVTGWLVYLLERGVVEDYTSTMNLLLVARRRSDVDPPGE
jgi:SAM-dependent methyltransferase